MAEQKTLDEIGALFVADIQRAFDDKRLNDRGGARASISYKTEPNKIVIEGLARVMFLQYGRRAGVMPPVSVIEGWVRRKLNVPDEEVRGVAFAIAMKIKKKGTNILTDKTKGLQLDLIIAELLDELLKTVSTFEAQRVANTILDTWKK